MTKKRVLIVSPSTLTDFDGKTFRLRRYAQAFEEMDYDVDFLTAKCESLRLANRYQIFEAPINLESIFEDKYKPILTEISNTSRLMCRFCVEVFSLVKSRDYSMVLSSYESPGLSTIAAIMAAKLMNIPHIYDYDDPGPEMSLITKGWPTSHPFYRMQLFVEKIICQHSDVTFVMSETMKELLMRSGSSKKIEVIHNVPLTKEIKFTESMKQSREKLGIPTDSFVFAYIGNVQRYTHGLEILVKGINILKDSDNDFLVLIVGTGSGERYFKEKIRRLNLSKYFLFTGKVSNEQAHSYLNAANVSLIILPSINADYLAPTKLFISMALGKHIVATESKQIRRILGSTPIYLEKHSTIRKMAEAMQEAKKKFQRENTNREYRNLFLSRYCWEREGETFIKIIEDLS